MDLSKWISQQTDRVAARVAVADALGVSEMAVRHWCNGIRRIPGERCIDVEEATNGAVTRYELRPDIFGPAHNATEAA